MSDQPPPASSPRGAGDVKIVSVAATYDAQPMSAVYPVLSPEQAVFFKSQIRIDDDEDLKTHIVEVAEKAYKIFPYPCIQSFTFLRLGLATLPTYDRIIQLGRERSNGILLDIGCCFGVDARKAVADGFPLKNVVITDLKQEFSDLGHHLFKTTSESYPITFVAGDAFDPEMLKIVPPLDEPPSEIPDLSTLTSLNPLAGHCAVIFASNFFHLFNEENQFKLAKALAGLLSSEPGSVICGEHNGDWEKGMFHLEYVGKTVSVFRHSPESWRELWDGGVFEKGKVKVETDIELVERGLGLKYCRLQWSVVRL